VTPIHVREILHVPKLSVIWSTLPCDITSLMRHVVSALNIIHGLRDVAHSISSGSYSKDDDHDPPLHDPPPD
jgi:hypothetical protein